MCNGLQSKRAGPAISAFLGSPAHACNVSCAHHTISLGSDAVTHHDPPCGSMRTARAAQQHESVGYAARTHYAGHAMAMAGDPGPSRSPPRDERGARDRLGAVSVGLDVSGGLFWGLSSIPSVPPLVVIISPPAVEAPPAPQASGPPVAASSWDACAHPPGSSPAVPQGPGGWHPGATTLPARTPTRAPHPQPCAVRPGVPSARRVLGTARAATPGLAARTVQRAHGAHAEMGHITTRLCHVV